MTFTEEELSKIDADLEAFAESAKAPSAPTPDPKPKKKPAPRRTPPNDPIVDKVKQKAKEYDVDPNIAAALMAQESAGKKRAKSWAGASGLFQLMPDTAAKYGVTDPYDPDQNINAGLKHVAYLKRRYGGDYRKVLAAYNAGEGRVDSLVKKYGKNWFGRLAYLSNDPDVQKGAKPRGPSDPTNTLNYVNRILGNAKGKKAYTAHQYKFTEDELKKINEDLSAPKFSKEELDKINADLDSYARSKENYDLFLKEQGLTDTNESRQKYNDKLTKERTSEKRGATDADYEEYRKYAEEAGEMVMAKEDFFKKAGVTKGFDADAKTYAIEGTPEQVEANRKYNEELEDYNTKVADYNARIKQYSDWFRQNRPRPAESRQVRTQAVRPERKGPLNRLYRVDLRQAQTGSLRNEVISQVAAALSGNKDFDYDAVRSYMRTAGLYRRGRPVQIADLEESLKSGGVMTVEVDPGDLEAMRELSTKLRETKTSADTDFEKRKVNLVGVTTKADKDLAEFLLRLEVDKEHGLIDEQTAEKLRADTVNAMRAWVEDRGVLGLWNQEEYEQFKSKFWQGIDTAARVGTSGPDVNRSVGYDSSRISSDVVKGMDLEYNKMIEQYGSPVAWKLAKDQMEKVYKQNGFLFVYDAAQTVTGQVVKAVPKAVGAVADVLANVNEVANNLVLDLVEKVNPYSGTQWGDRADKAIKGARGLSAAYNNPAGKIGDGLNHLTENFMKSPEYFRGGNVELFGDVIGQVGVQTIAGLLTGGAATPALIGAATGASGQYRDIRKMTEERYQAYLATPGAEKISLPEFERRTGANWQRLGAVGVGGILAAPEYFIFRNWLNTAKTFDRIKFVNRMTSKVENSLISLGLAKGEARKQAVQFTDGFLDRLIREGGVKGLLAEKVQFYKQSGKNVLKGGFPEGIQEPSEGIGNDLYAYMTYDPSEERWNKATSLSSERLTEGVAGFFGGALAVSTFDLAARAKMMTDEALVDSMGILEKVRTPDQLVRDMEGIIALEMTARGIPVQRRHRESADELFKRIAAGQKEGTQEFDPEVGQQLIDQGTEFLRPQQQQYESFVRDTANEAPIQEQASPVEPPTLAPDVEDKGGVGRQTTEDLKPVPESETALSAQLAAAEDITDQTRSAVLYTGDNVELAPTSPKYHRIRMKTGDVLIVPKKAWNQFHAQHALPGKANKDSLVQFTGLDVNSENTRLLLGGVESVPDTSSQPVVVASDPETGTQLAADAVTTPESAQRQAESYENQFGDVDVAVKTPTEVAEQRLGDIENEQQTSLFEEAPKALPQETLEAAGIEPPEPPKGVKPVTSGIVHVQRSTTRELAKVQLANRVRKAGYDFEIYGKKKVKVTKVPEGKSIADFEMDVFNMNQERLAQREANKGKFNKSRKTKAALSLYQWVISSGGIKPQFKGGEKLELMEEVYGGSDIASAKASRDAYDGGEIDRLRGLAVGLVNSKTGKPAEDLARDAAAAGYLVAMARGGNFAGDNTYISGDEFLALVEEDFAAGGKYYSTDPDAQAELEEQLADEELEYYANRDREGDVARRLEMLSEQEFEKLEDIAAFMSDRASAVLLFTAEFVPDAPDTAPTQLIEIGERHGLSKQEVEAVYQQLRDVYRRSVEGEPETQETADAVPGDIPGGDQPADGSYYTESPYPDEEVESFDDVLSFFDEVAREEVAEQLQDTAGRPEPEPEAIEAQPEETIEETQEPEVNQDPVPAVETIQEPAVDETGQAGLFGDISLPKPPQEPKTKPAFLESTKAREVNREIELPEVDMRSYIEEGPAELVALPERDRVARAKMDRDTYIGNLFDLADKAIKTAVDLHNSTELDKRPQATKLLAMVNDLNSLVADSAGIFGPQTAASVVSALIDAGLPFDRGTMAMDPALLTPDKLVTKEKKPVKGPKAAAKETVKEEPAKTKVVIVADPSKNVAVVKEVIDGGDRDGATVHVIKVVSGNDMDAVSAEAEQLKNNYVPGTTKPSTEQNKDQKMEILRQAYYGRLRRKQAQSDIGLSDEGIKQKAEELRRLQMLEDDNLFAIAVRHVSGVRFNYFDYRFMNKGVGDMWFTPGFYFATSPGVVRYYKGQFTPSLSYIDTNGVELNRYEFEVYLQNELRQVAYEQALRGEEFVPPADGFIEYYRSLEAVTDATGAALDDLAAAVYNYDLPDIDQAKDIMLAALRGMASEIKDGWVANLPPEQLTVRVNPSVTSGSSVVITPAAGQDADPSVLLRKALAGYPSSTAGYDLTRDLVLSAFSEILRSVNGATSAAWGSVYEESVGSMTMAVPKLASKLNENESAFSWIPSLEAPVTYAAVDTDTRRLVDRVYKEAYGPALQEKLNIVAASLENLAGVVEKLDFNAFVRSGGPVEYEITIDLDEDQVMQLDVPDGTPPPTGVYSRPKLKNSGAPTMYLSEQSQYIQEAINNLPEPVRNALVEKLTHSVGQTDWQGYLNETHARGFHDDLSGLIYGVRELVLNPTPATGKYISRFGEVSDDLVEIILPYLAMAEEFTTYDRGVDAGGGGLSSTVGEAAINRAVAATAASFFLSDNGIKAVRYLDSTSRRGQANPSYNYVVYDINSIKIENMLYKRLPSQDFQDALGDILTKARIVPEVYKGYVGFRMNRAAAEVIAQVLGRDLDGITFYPDTAEAFLSKLGGLRNAASDPDVIANLDRFEAQMRNILDQNGGYAYGYLDSTQQDPQRVEETRTEERFHMGQLMTSSGVLRGVHTQQFVDDTVERMRKNGSYAYLRAMGYPDDKHILVLEAAAKAASGEYAEFGWTREQAADFLVDAMLDMVEQNPAMDLEYFRKLNDLMDIAIGPVEEYVNERRQAEIEQARGREEGPPRGVQDSTQEQRPVEGSDQGGGVGVPTEEGAPEVGPTDGQPVDAEAAQALFAIRQPKKDSSDRSDLQAEIDKGLNLATGQYDQKRAEWRRVEDPATDEYAEHLVEYNIGIPVDLRAFNKARPTGIQGDPNSLFDGLENEDELREMDAKVTASPQLGRQSRGALMAKKLWRSFFETFEGLDPKKGPVHAVVNDILRKLQSVPAAARDLAEYQLVQITKGLSKEQTELMGRYIYYLDVMRDYNAGMYNDNHMPRQIGTYQNLVTLLERTEALIEQNPEIQEALRKRHAWTSSLVREAVAVGVLPETVLESVSEQDGRPVHAYFHHKVYDFIEPVDFGDTYIRGDVREQQKGFQRARGSVDPATGNRRGSIREVSLDYVTTEFEWTSDIISSIEHRKALIRLKATADIRPELEAELAIRREAGEDVTLKDLVREREGYTSWLPKKNTFFAPAVSYYERIFDAIANRDALLSELPERYEWALEEVDEETGQERIRNVRSNKIVKVPPQFWVVPDDIAQVFDTFMSREFSWTERAATSTLDIWKKWTLLNPARVMVYNLNNVSGDLDIVMAYDPRMASYLWKAAGDLWQYQIQRRGAGEEFDGNDRGRRTVLGAAAGFAAGTVLATPAGGIVGAALGARKRDPISEQGVAEIQRAFKDGVIDSGLTISEIPDVAYTEHLEELIDPGPNLEKLVRKLFRTPAKYTNWRENILRLAAYRYFKDKLSEGKLDYGASNAEQIDAILEDPSLSAEEAQLAAAAKMSRELVGDYGAVSAGGRWLARHLIPFWRFQEINAPRYMRILRNIYKETGVPGSARFVATYGITKAPSWTLNTLTRAGTGYGLFVLKTQLLTAMVYLWNSLRWPEEDRELKNRGDRNMLILGRTADGQIRTLKLAGAFRDMMEWMDLEDAPEDIAKIYRGDKTFSDILAEAAKAPVNKMVQVSMPLVVVKPAAEMIAGGSSYPTIFKEGTSFTPRLRPIRDRFRHLANSVSLAAAYDIAYDVYRRFSGDPKMPKRPRDLSSYEDIIGLLMDMTVAYRFDAQEIARQEVVMHALEWAEENGIAKAGGVPTAKANALFWYKQAVRFGDEEAAEDWKNKYLSYPKSSEEGIEKSVENSHPLAVALNKGDWLDYIQSLNESQLERLKLAIAHYHRTYLLDPSTTQEKINKDFDAMVKILEAERKLKEKRDQKSQRKEEAIDRLAAGDPEALKGFNKNERQAIRKDLLLDEDQERFSSRALELKIAEFEAYETVEDKAARAPFIEAAMYRISRKKKKTAEDRAVYNRMRTAYRGFMTDLSKLPAAERQAATAKMNQGRKALNLNRRR